MPSDIVSVSRVVDSSRFSGLQKRVIGICLLLGFADGFNSLAVGYAIPSLAEKWQVNAGTFSMVVVAGVVGEILASVTLAPLADRFGRRPLIWAGLLLFGVSTGLAAFAAGLGLLVVCRFVSGLGIGAASPNLFALGTEYSPRRVKSTAVTVIGTGMAGGGAVCGLFASVLVPIYGWQAVFVVAGVLPLVALAATAAFLPESIEFYARTGRSEKVARLLTAIDGTRVYPADGDYRLPADVRAKPGPAALFRDGRAVTTVLLWSMLLLGIAGSYFVFSWLATLLVNVGVPQSQALLATSLSTLGGIVGGIGLGVLTDRSRAGYKIIILGPVVTVLATLGLVADMGTGASVGIAILACVALGAGIVGVGTTLTAVVAQAYPTELRSTGIGWAAGFSRLGAIFAPVVGGDLLTAGYSSQTILLYSLVPTVLLAVLIAVYAAVGRPFVESADPQAASAQVEAALAAPPAVP